MKTLISENKTLATFTQTKVGIPRVRKEKKKYYTYLVGGRKIRRFLGIFSKKIVWSFRLIVYLCFGSFSLTSWIL